MSDFDVCSDCSIERHEGPTPGNCPCCFSPMTKAVNFRKDIIYVCTRKDCRRVCTPGFLSGFWSGWQEKERQIEED